MTDDTEKRTNRHFTFGSGHMSSYPLPASGGLLADYWVTVSLPEEMKESHRYVFISEFTDYYCPRPTQFAMEYTDDEMKPEFFPGGQLCLITEKGIQYD